MTVLPDAPSAFVARFTHLIRPGGAVLDLACGAGRHTRFLLGVGHRVVAVDRDVSGVVDLRGVPGVEVLEVDLESGPWPLAGRTFDGVVVTNYLWRPRFTELLAAVGERGALLYETFAIGNERFGRPQSPDHLLRPGELLDRVAGQLTVVAYEHGVVSVPRAAVVQRLAAVRGPVGSLDAGRPVAEALRPHA